MSLKFKKRMAKMKQHLGFTLIEMLVVIAIIAILVSIITPVATIYTTKSNAATNAANLRAVKATISTMLLSGEIDYATAQDSSSLVSMIDGWINQAEDDGAKTLLETVKLAVRFGGYTAELGARMVNTYYGTEDGIVDVDGKTLTAPVSKAINVSGLKLRAGTPMTATVHDDAIIVTYGGIPLEVFAEIAKNGDASKIDMSQYDHPFVDANSNGECDYCGSEIFKGKHSDKSDAIGDVVDGMINGHHCIDTDDHFCDDPTCHLPVSSHTDASGDKDHTCDKNGCTTTGVSNCYDDDEDGNCDECGEPYTSSDSCVTPDTLVTLADGSKKRMAEVTNSDYLMVWDFFNGQYAAVPASVLVFHGNNYYDVCTLVFEDGTKVETIGGHDFFDFNLNEFVTIDEFNASSYVGHSFAKASGSSYKAVKLVDYIVENKYTGSYSLISAMHNNFIVEDMISLTPLTLIDTDNFFEYFEVGAGMKYDEAKMQADIETYGLYTYEDFADYLTYEQYVALNAPYYKVLVGKGYVTFADLLTAISAYVN